MAVIEARVIDTTHLELLKPIGLPKGAHVVVSVAEADPDPERTSWQAISQSGLQRAYSDDEPEYSLDMLQDKNPEYRNAGR